MNMNSNNINLATDLCTLITAQATTIIEITELRLLGQEQNGLLLFSWLENVSNVPNSVNITKIGIYKLSKNSLNILYAFKNKENVIQASVNDSQTLLAFVTKTTHHNENITYKASIVNLKNYTVYEFKQESSKQIMVQFLYKKHSILTEDHPPIEILLLFIHQESILLHEINLKKISDVNNIDESCFTCEVLVHVFYWAQWDCVNQVLYYIHDRKPIRCLIEGEEQDIDENFKVTPTLSAFQFHDELPHETVLNIPMNLPHMTMNQLPTQSAYNTCYMIYEDDVIPLRIHDSSLDLQIVSNSNGIVCICHHYVYQTEQNSSSDDVPDDDNDAQRTVNFAYSVTLLHHSCIIHCIIPGIPWSQAKQVYPTFLLHNDHHLLVFVPGLFSHLLDIGMSHEPCCHVITAGQPLLNHKGSDVRLVPLCYGSNLTINLNTLDVISLTVPASHLIETFKSDTHLDNKLAIMHYFIVHNNDFEAIEELLSTFTEKPLTFGISQLLEEFLIGSSYASMQRSLPADANQLVNLLPVTTLIAGKDINMQTYNSKYVRLTQNVLWNTAMMLLSPQQRIIPYRVDLWTKLWENLMQTTKAKTKTKFKSNQVTDKLMVSLTCYQPEALSRSSTPLSPVLGIGVGVPTDFSTNRKNQLDALPFDEFESCTASKQEHIISVNLRELSMHLLKHNFIVNNINITNNNRKGCNMNVRWQSQTPMHVHAVATKYVSAQLEQSKCLCQLLCRSVNIYVKHEHEKGFLLIDRLQDEKKYLLFTLLQRYYFAVEALAFPLPQGFTSFFTFLGYRTLKFDIFLQYIHRNVFELQVDVMKIIMADKNDSKQEITEKLQLLSLLPRSRAKRLLNSWMHPVSSMLRAREHALNILSGVEGPQPRARGLQRTLTSQFGLAAFPSADRLSPLDTFLDLLTAKANLTELDFGLLVEATVTSTEEFFFN